MGSVKYDQAYIPTFIRPPQSQNDWYSNHSNPVVYFSRNQKFSWPYVIGINVIIEYYKFILDDCDLLDLISKENLEDRASPELWPEQSKL